MKDMKRHAPLLWSVFVVSMVLGAYIALTVLGAL